MINYKIISSLIALVITINISGQNKPVNRTGLISVAPHNETIKFSEIFTGYRIFRLKSDDQHFLKTVSRVIPIENKFIIVASSDKSRVHIYDRNGEYITNVGLIGRGPAEYLSIRSLKVYPLLKRIEILDYNKNSILRFSSENGKFLNEIKIGGDLYPDDFERIDDDYYMLFEKFPAPMNNLPGNRIKVYSITEKKTVNEFVPVDPIFSNYLYFGEITNLYQFNNSVCFFTSFNDTIYSLSKQQKNIRYIFDFGKYQIKKSVLYNDYKEVIDFGNKCIESKCIWDINTLLETLNVIFFRFRYIKDFYYSFFDKKTNKITSSNMFEDDLVLNKTGPSTEMIKPIGKGDNCLFFRLEVPYFLTAIENLKKTSSKEEWQKYIDTHKQIIELFNSLDVNENDLVLEFQLRN